MTDNIRGTLGYSGHADKWRKRTVWEVISIESFN